MLQIRTVDGSVDWVRYDDRFFAPPTGTTFGSSMAAHAGTLSQWGPKIESKVPSQALGFHGGRAALAQQV